MKILLDECVDQKLRLAFAEHDCQTAAYAKLAGMKNGALLAAAEAANFEILITTDQEIPYQQNLDVRRISIIILCANTNRLADLKLLVPAALHALNSVEPGQVLRLR
jgi:predicted nuclease of predicted toxin-antitoxin system